ncbi:MAG: hypothetical protein J5819_05170 [Eubacterium sp.]|nr:hypothetical protein [Eubacterium sp.]
MSNRKDSLKRQKRLNKATRGYDFERHYTMDGEEETERSRLSRYFWILIAIGVACVLSAGIILWIFFGTLGGESEPEEEPQVTEEPVAEPTAPPATQDEIVYDDEPEIWRMTDRATFLQGPKGWKRRQEWSGKWGKTNYDGRSFGGFGCGLCVMANFYSSFTPYQCSPVDIYEYAKQVTSYEGGCAIDWPQISATLEHLGFTVDTNRKPKRYDIFRDDIKNCMGAMVVISSAYDDSYWRETPGHYVTILAYNAANDTIFLGDSGDLEHNRSWIPLKTVYKAIKKSNALHYLRVNSYDETQDEWKHTVISGKWCKPGYWEK